MLTATCFCSSAIIFSHHSARKSRPLRGGHKEGEETFLECVVREIAEETSQHIPAERFQHLFSLDGADPEGPGDHLRGEFFVAYDVPTDALVITEGKPLIVPPDAIWEMRAELTPATLPALNAFMSRQIAPA